MEIGVVAGEASGDLLGAGFLTEFQKLQPNVTATGIAGPAMLAAGCRTLHDMDRLSVMGLVEPLKRLPELFRIRRDLLQYFTQHRPAFFMGIDSPDFNLGLELKLRALGIPTIHYVSPSVWAWRQKRIFKIARATDLVLTLFPFEEKFYQEHRVPVRFVGHPLADLIPLVPDKIAARKKLGLDLNATYIAILPGSRQNELKYLGEIFLRAAKLCWQAHPEIKFITSSVNSQRDSELQTLKQNVVPDLPLTCFQILSHDVMAAADLILVASGTATLEAMLFKRPMVIAYRMAGLTYHIARHLVKIPFIGLPNLLAQEKLVPELIQDAVTPEQLAHALLDYLEHPEKIALLNEKFLHLHQQLRCDANKTAAAAAMELIKK